MMVIESSIHRKLRYVILPGIRDLPNHRDPQSGKDLQTRSNRSSGGLFIAMLACFIGYSGMNRFALLVISKLEENRIEFDRGWLQNMHECDFSGSRGA